MNQQLHNGETSPHPGLAASTARHYPRAWQRPEVDRILHRDEHLFHEGESLTRAYVVVSGILKSYVIDEDGREQIIGFHMAGDTIGFEAVAGCPAASSVQALNTTSVRRISEAGAGNRTESTNQAVLLGMYQEMLRLTRTLQMERRSLEQRLAVFLIDFGERQARAGCSRNEFLLPMGRKDLARHLGLAPETLSRVFSRFRNRGILNVDDNHVTVLDPDALRLVAGHWDSPSTRHSGNMSG